MASGVLRGRRSSPANSPEVDFALVLSRVIDSLREDPAELRNVVYELARAKLQDEAWNISPRMDSWELRRLTVALETAIDRVEAFSSRQDELRALKSLDRLIEGLDQPRPSLPASSSNPVRLIDHSSTSKGYKDRLTEIREFASRVTSALSQTRLQYRLAPLLRACFVVVLTVGLYAIFSGRHQFLTSHIPDSVAPAGGAKKAAEPKLTAEPPSAGARPAAAQPRDFPLPTFYGVFALSEGKLYELEALPGRIPNQKLFMSAVMSKSSRTLVPDGRVAFVAFRRDLATNAPDRASVRVIARIMRAMSFPAGRKPTTVAVDDSWAIRNVSYDLRVAPLADNAEMLVIRPDNADFVLAPGRYALVFKDVGYDFTVAGKITDPAQCLERTEAANGTFYSECRTP